jgi:uncharacterized protein (TIGR03086 family)
VDALLTRHHIACDGFASVADRVADDDWDAPTPCSDWDARALVEHVIGFHEVLILRPLGVRAGRPRTGPAARWRATQAALMDALEQDGAPRDLLAALTTDVLVHTWDLARATAVPAALDADLCRVAYEAATVGPFPRDPTMFGPAVPVADDADLTTKLLAFYGRDPSWTR